MKYRNEKNYQNKILRYRDSLIYEEEFLKAGNDECKVYLMIEAHVVHFDIIGHKYCTEFTAYFYMASLKTFEHRFDANIQFISPEYAGYYKISIFQYYAREILK